MKKKVSVVLATRNEEKNIADCIMSVKDIADEIIIADEESTDNTPKIARELGAKVYSIKHSDNFHATKQFALEKAKNEWILQLDADERVTSELAQEILQVIDMTDSEIISRTYPSNKKRLLKKHEALISDMLHLDKGEVCAFLLPRLNYFLGKPLRGAGVYPDPAIRLVKRGKAHFPVKSVHENMVINGRVAWLFNDLEHHDSPTLSRYLMRLNRYTSLQATDLENQNVGKNLLHLVYYSTLKPLLIFLKLYIFKRGYKDGMIGFVWSVFSSSHFPISYFKYYSKQ